MGEFLVSLILGSMLVFSTLHLSPGSPLATLSGGRALTPEATAALESRYGLDQPLWTQYISWFGRAIQGNLGESIVYQVPVSAVMGQGLQISFVLLTLALILIVAIGLIMGFLSGLSGRGTDIFVSSLFSVGLALPAFVAAPILIAVFAVALGWFPVLYDSSNPSISQLILPSVAIAVSLIAFVGRLTRSNVINAASTDVADFARLRGLSPARIVRTYILRPSLLGITTSVGLTLSSLVGALIVVEVAFQLPGFGYFLIAAVNGRDYVLVQGMTLMLFVFFLCLNTLIDLLYPFLDPRISRRTVVIP
ncbi:MAG: ABC transporter permease [Homoserinimonas sp.]